MDTPITLYLQFAKQLATDVVHQMQSSHTALTIEKKAVGDWFSALDLKLERDMRERVRTTYPSHGFLGEEDGASDQRDWMWVVDPIDGSMNFLRGFPHYSVSIALLYQGEPWVACVADPVRREFFTAAKGMGAHLNDQPIRASQVNQLSEAVVATVFPKPTSAQMTGFMQRLDRVLRGVAGARRSGSMALDLAYLAAARVDAFWAQNMGPWDAAAGVLLVQEAGAEVFTLDQRHWLASHDIAASTTGLAREWRAMLLG